ncbi:unnamed protein product [Soboliphyme baturini]|uniref:BTB domain-containing protein n=1 Tax=Soboliphyme baturini TaxID=241478 RepID=A0A183ITZ3_9BILA|nr:unnamed protein product [Soboliphyme baturini]
MWVRYSLTFRIQVVSSFPHYECGISDGSKSCRRPEGNLVEIVILTELGHLYVWSEVDRRLRRCVFIDVSSGDEHPLPLYAQSFWCNDEYILLISEHGIVFVCRRMNSAQGDKIHLSLSSGALDFTASDKPTHLSSEYYILSVVTIPGVLYGYRAVSTTDGRNYAIIQSAICLDRFANVISSYDFPCVSASFVDYFRDQVLGSSSRTVTSDITIVCEAVNFYCHKFILASRSDYFAKHVVDDRCSTLEITDVQPGILQQILEYIYTNDCETLRKRRQRLSLLIKPDSDTVHSFQQTVAEKLLIKACVKFCLSELQNKLEISSDLKSVEKCDSCILNHLRFARESFPDLYDINFVCADGITLGAHQCMLEARVPYFATMLSSQWTTDHTVRTCGLPSLPVAVVKDILTYVYSNETPLCSLDKNDRTSTSERWEDSFSNLKHLLMQADQWLMDPLRNFCQRELSRHITRKNVVGLLHLCHTIPLEQLRKLCLEFICLNLSAFFETDSFSDIPEEILTELEGCYKKMFEADESIEINPFVVSAEAPHLQVPQGSFDRCNVPCTSSVVNVATFRNRHYVWEASPSHLEDGLQNIVSLDEIVNVEEEVDLSKIEKEKVSTPSATSLASHLGSSPLSRKGWELEDGLQNLVHLREIMNSEEKLFHCQNKIERKKISTPTVTSPSSPLGSSPLSKKGWDKTPDVVNQSVGSNEVKSFSKIVEEQRSGIEARNELVSKPFHFVQVLTLALCTKDCRVVLRIKGIF